MTLWKAEQGFAPLMTTNAPGRSFAVISVVAIAAASGLLLIWLVPLALVLPVLSIMSFMIAGAAALVAHYSGIDRHAPAVSAWDIAAVFTVIWIAAAMAGGARPFTELFDRLAAIP